MPLSLDQVQRIQRTFESVITSEGMKKPFLVTVFDRDGKAFEKVYCREELAERFRVAGPAAGQKKVSPEETRKKIQACDGRLLTIDGELTEIHRKLGALPDHDVKGIGDLTQNMDKLEKERDKLGLERAQLILDLDSASVKIRDSENDEIELSSEILVLGEDADKIMAIACAAAFKATQGADIKANKDKMKEAEVAEAIRFFSEHYSDATKLLEDNGLLHEYELAYETVLADKKRSADNADKKGSNDKPKDVIKGYSEELLNFLRPLMTTDPEELKVLKDKESKRLIAKADQRKKMLLQQGLNGEKKAAKDNGAAAPGGVAPAARGAEGVEDGADAKREGEYVPGFGGHGLFVGYGMFVGLNNPFGAGARPPAAGAGAAAMAAAHGVHVAAGWAPAPPAPDRRPAGGAGDAAARAEAPRPAGGAAAAADRPAPGAAAARAEAPRPAAGAAAKPAPARKPAADPAAPKAKPKSVRF